MKKVYTLEELEALKAAFDSRIREAKEEITANRAELEEVAQKMEAATQRGDIAGYKKLHGRRAELELNIEAVQAITERAIAQNACGFTDEDVNAAWAAYVEPFNKKAEERTAQLQQLREALYNRYVELAKEQNEVLKARDRFTGFLTRSSVRYGRGIEFEAIKGLPDTDKALDVSHGLEGTSERELTCLQRICFNLDAVEWRP